MSAQLACERDCRFRRKPFAQHLGPHLEPRFLGWCCCCNSRLSLSRATARSWPVLLRKEPMKSPARCELQHLERSNYYSAAAERSSGCPSVRRSPLRRASTETRIFVNFVVTLEGEAAPPGPGAPPPLTTSRERRDQWPTDNYDFLPSKFNRPPPTRRVLRLQTGRGYGPVRASFPG